MINLSTIYAEHLALLDFQIEYAEKFNLPIVDELKVVANKLRGELEVLRIINGKNETAKKKQAKDISGQSG